MIGDKNSTDIALGYEVRKYSELSPEEKKIVPDRLTKAVDDFATAAKAAINALKEGSSVLKASLEKTKDDLRATSTDDDFHKYLFGQGTWKSKGYIEQLRKIGVTAKTIFDDVSLKSAVSTLNIEVGKSEPTGATPVVTAVTTPTTPVVTAPTTDTKPPAKSYAFSAEIDSTKLQVVIKTKVTGATEVIEPIPLLTVFTDSKQAYQEVTGATTVRKTYLKKGKSDYRGTDATQYVQDDAGIYTRRYAVMHKPIDVMQALLAPDGVVKGKLQHALGVTKRPGSTDPLAPDPEIYKVQKDEKGRLAGKKKGDTLDTREMLHVHQELGSGDSGRGLCLTSISLSESQALSSDWKKDLKTMYANDGIAFKSPGKTVPVLVDMGRVPTGKDLLYNLYRPDAQAQAKNVPIRKGQMVFRNNNHMLDSVTKNRELFLRVLLRDYIVNWAEIEPELKPKTTVATATPSTGVTTGPTKTT